MFRKYKTRIYVDNKLSIGLIVHIKDKQHHFLKNVLRIKVSEQISLFDNITGEWIAKIISINRHNISVQVLKEHKKMYLEPDIWLIFSPIKQQRMNITFQKATELGVSKFIPIITNYTSVDNLNYKNLKLNIIEAAEQCGRLTIPSLENIVKIDDFLNNHPKDRALIFCNEKEKSNESIFKKILLIKDNFKKWTIIIGPEGGFSSEEVEKIKKTHNCNTVSLGKRILRSDTATTAALFCLQSIIETN